MPDWSMSERQGTSQIAAENCARHQTVLQHIAIYTPAFHVHGKAQAAQQPFLKACMLVAGNMPEGVVMCTCEYSARNMN